MHLLWLKMYVPAVEEHASAPVEAEEFEEISGLIEDWPARADEPTLVDATAPEPPSLPQRSGVVAVPSRKLASS